MDPETTALAGGPFDTQPRLTQIAQAVMPSGMIADEVCPRVRTGYKFTYTTLTEEDLLTIPDTKASRASALNQIEFGASDATDSVVDYGLEDPVPHRDIDEARVQEVPYDPLALASEATAELVRLGREKRVADLVHTASNYGTGLSTTLAGNAQWSDGASSNPREAILEALDKPLVRPNILVFGQKVWTKLRQHPKIVEAIKLSGAGDQASGVVMKEAVAALFEVDRVLVGQAWYQSAKRGQANAFARLWGNHACAIFVKPGMTARDRMPKFCWTADAMGGLQVGTYEAPERGVNRGSTVVKVSECVKELVAYKSAGYLWRNAVA